jgi:hypothetical protein
MMKKIKSLITTLALATTCSFSGGDIIPIPMEPEYIDSEETQSIPIYIGIGATYAEIERDGCGGCGQSNEREQDGRVGLILKAGFNVSDYLDIEARGLTTFGSDVYSKTSHIGLYLKPKMLVAEDLTVYGLLGYGNTKVDYEKSTEDASGASYGLGVEYDTNGEEPGLGIWMDFQNLLNDEGTTNTSAYAISAGLIYSF